MSSAANIFLRYRIDSRGFLERATESLARFDTSADASDFFFAALQLRFGIEARLCEYIDAALGSVKRKDAAIKEYTATRLLNRLVGLNPDVHRAVTLVIGIEGEDSRSAMQYIPVTPRLAAIHGRLGELLHYNYFWKHEHWYVNKEWKPGSVETIADARGLLLEGFEELTRATAGTLLSHPQFSTLVEELEAEVEAEATPRSAVSSPIMGDDFPSPPATP
jgi:hypothetical protein